MSGTPRTRIRRSEAGFSLFEMLVATAIMVIVTGAIFGLLDPSHGTYRTQPEVSDMQQRLRVAIDALERDLSMAGAGTYTGSAQGALANFFAPILPYSVGTMVSEGSPENPVDTAITIMYVPPTPAQTSLSSPMPNESAELKVRKQPNCPPDKKQQLCGFESGMRVLIFDDRGAFDVFTITHVQDAALHLQHRDDKFTTEYATDAYITAVESHTYYFNATERRLYHYDGYKSNVPVVDNVVALRFEYFGEPMPPALRKPVTDTVGPWTTYGPKPPPAGTDHESDDYGAGENCVFMLSGGTHVPRLEDWLGGAAPGTLVPIPLEAFSDGPWCPGQTNKRGNLLPNRFDADLLRVRRVRVTVRVQAGDETLRGTNPDGRTLFVNPGKSKGGAAWVPDQEIRFEVTPRNMNIGR
ncbi:MAG TPA: prepilin-type N-terminal cleavage/methylation domain-containing protein [Vicinamibacterales bacterium]|nr:prepilin-type N-terminal cleavage/methylation domain-containing protein [Vicinamibacterales bacterium]